ncbi:hypothetical protein [Pedobacter sp. UYP30]|uniref:hypothetical protein n=1 Tax=Pedobacter sp. UYP30 TaxID=1756400 RepID=UPI003399E5AD
MRPGKSVQQFILEDRNRLVKPIIFIVLTSLIYTLVCHFFNIEPGYIVFRGNAKSTLVTIFSWIQNHYVYANIMIGICIALWTKLFFKKHKFNFYEILILLCFVLGMTMLFYTIFALFQKITHVKLIQFGGLADVAWHLGNWTVF